MPVNEVKLSDSEEEKVKCATVSPVVTNNQDQAVTETVQPFASVLLSGTDCPMRFESDSHTASVKERDGQDERIDVERGLLPTSLMDTGYESTHSQDCARATVSDGVSQPVAEVVDDGGPDRVNSHNQVPLKTNPDQGLEWHKPEVYGGHQRTALLAGCQIGVYSWFLWNVRRDRLFPIQSGPAQIRQQMQQSGPLTGSVVTGAGVQS